MSLPANVNPLYVPRCAFSVAFAMPTRWTFAMPPVAAFIERHLRSALSTVDIRHGLVVVDPFCGHSEIATHRNDLAYGGQDAELWVRELISQGVRADAVLFDPPYSPRQIAECYKGIGREATTEATQNGRLYKRVRTALSEILKATGVALSFGWQSAGFGREWDTTEILLVQHGGAHTDTICVAQRRARHQMTLAEWGQ